MTAWLARIQVSLKPVVNDPEGHTIGRALRQLGFGSVSSVRTGKFFEIELEAGAKEEALASVESMCRRLLANPVIEDFRFTIRPARRRGANRSPAGRS